MDADMNVVAKLGPVLNGTFKYKEAGKKLLIKVLTIFVETLAGLETWCITSTLKRTSSSLTSAK